MFIEIVVDRNSQLSRVVGREDPRQFRLEACQGVANPSRSRGWCVFATTPNVKPRRNGVACNRSRTASVAELAAVRSRQQLPTLTCATVQTACGFATILSGGYGSNHVAEQMAHRRPPSICLVIGITLVAAHCRNLSRSIAYPVGSQSVGKPSAKEGHDHDEARTLWTNA
jgi:hypothetical protein